MADQQLFDAGRRPRVMINWESFERRGIPPDWRRPFAGAAINAYTRWADAAGVDVRFQFFGYTEKTHVGDGEVLISMDDRHASEARLTSTFGERNQLEIVFHRLSGEDLSPWPFVPYTAGPDEYDLQAVLVHEFGHGLGLDHSADGAATLGRDYDHHAYRFGPFEAEVARARALYPPIAGGRLRQLRSTDGGASWAPVSNDLSGLDDWRARTSSGPSVVALSQGRLYVVGWTTLGGAIAGLRGDGHQFLMRHWNPPAGGAFRYGPAMATDGDHTIVRASVGGGDASSGRADASSGGADASSGGGDAGSAGLDSRPASMSQTGSGTISLVWSVDQGATWQSVGAPAGARTYGTPGVCCTRIDGRAVWILVWSDLNPGDSVSSEPIRSSAAAPSAFTRDEPAASGRLRASLSHDGGETWTAPQAIDGDPGYLALAGVSVAADSDNHLLVAFAWAPRSTRGLNQIRTFVCQVRDGRLAADSLIGGEAVTRLQPALTFDPLSRRFQMAWRDQDFLTSVRVASLALGEQTWTDQPALEITTSAPPALASLSTLGETVLWYTTD